MAEMIDAQNILIKNLISREYKDGELSQQQPRQSVDKKRRLTNHNQQVR